MKVFKGINFAGQASAPSSPANGDTYYDTTLQKLRCYQNGAWVNLSDSNGTVLLSDGSAASPSLAFINSTATGLYRVGADSLGFSANGVNVGQYSSAGLWTLGASGGTQTHFINGRMNITTPAGTNPALILTAVSTTTPFVRFTDGTTGYSIGNTTAGTFSIDVGTAVGPGSDPRFSITQAGLVTIGASGGTENHVINGSALIPSGNLRVGTSTNQSAGFEQASILQTIQSANLASSHAALTVRSFNGQTSAPTQPNRGILLLTDRTTSANVTDTNYLTGYESNMRFTPSAATTFTNTTGNGVSHFFLSGPNNNGAGNLAISNFYGIRFNNNTVNSGTRKTAISFGTWSGATNNAFIADNASFTGNWFINSTNTNDSLFSGHLNLAGQKELRLQDTTGGEYVGHRAPGTVTSSHTYTWPAALPAENRILQSDTSGNLSWVVAGAGSGDISNGGNSFGSAMTIGTNDAFDLNFETNAVTKGSVSSAGLWTLGESGGTQAHVINGTLGVGTSAGGNIIFRAQRTIPGTATTQYGIFQSSTFNSSAISSGVGIVSVVNVQDASFTMGNAYAFLGGTITKGASATLTRYTVFSSNAWTGVATNSAMIADNTSFTGDWFINSTSTAQTRINGSVGLGANPAAAFGLRVGHTALTGTAQIGINSNAVAAADATSSMAGITSGPSTANSAFTCGLFMAFNASNTAKGAASTITRHAMYYGGAPTQGTNNAFIADNASFTGDWFINSTNNNRSKLGNFYFEGVASALPTGFDSEIAFLRTDGTGSAPFDQAGSLVIRPRVSSTAGRSSVYIYTGSPSTLAFTVDEVQKITIGATSSAAVHVVNGGMRHTVRSISGATTLDTTTTDYIVLANSSSAGFTITLPAATSGRKLIIKDSGGSAQTNNITISPASGTIDGASTFVLNNNYQSVDLVSDGTNWFVV